MITVGQMCKRCKVSARTLRYYDSMGLLPRAGKTDSGYRLYNEESVRQLGTILLLKRRGFSLSDIKSIVRAKDFDISRAMDRHIEMLKIKRRHLDLLIENAIEVKDRGIENMDFSFFENKELDEYAQQVKQRWGQTDAYKEYCAKVEDKNANEVQQAGQGIMDIFKKFGCIVDTDPKSPQAQNLVAELQEYITENFYTCTKQILAGLGNMYTDDERFKNNIDNESGHGTAEFASRAIAYYVSK